MSSFPVDNPGHARDGPGTAARVCWRGVAIWASLAAAGGIYLAMQTGVGDLPMPRCVFHEATGWYCPGCGSGRAVHALLHLRPLAAWRANPLLMIALPVVLFFGARWVWDVVRRRPPRAAMSSVGRWGIYLIGLLVVLYWVGRNLPWWPWTLLAPR